LFSKERAPAVGWVWWRHRGHEARSRRKAASSLTCLDTSSCTHRTYT